MKKIYFIIFTLLCCFPTMIFAKGEDTDSYIECWYRDSDIYYYYNVTTDTFEFTGKAITRHSWTNKLIKSNFIDKNTNELKCPTIYTTTGSNGGSGITTITITKTGTSSTSLSANKTNGKNTNLTTTKTCVYSGENGRNIEFVLDISNNSIVSARVNGMDATSNAFSYDEIYKDNKCVNIDKIYASCYDGSHGGPALCNIVKENPYTGTGSTGSGDTTLDPDASTGDVDPDPTPDPDPDPTPDIDISTPIGGNHATEKDFLGDLTCGGTQFRFHRSLPNFTATMYDLLKIITPIIIVVMGMVDMVKAVAAQKEDEIKKGQQKLLRRFIAGVIVFLVFVIVEATIHMFAERNHANNAMDCVNCFLGGANQCGKFYSSIGQETYEPNDVGCWQCTAVDGISGYKVYYYGKYEDAFESNPYIEECKKLSFSQAKCTN